MGVHRNFETETICYEETNFFMIFFRDFIHKKLKIDEFCEQQPLV